jgi:hypothetical protein
VIGVVRNIPAVVEVSLVAEQQQAEEGRRLDLGQTLQGLLRSLEAVSVRHAVHHHESLAPAQMLQKTILSNKKTKSDVISTNKLNFYKKINVKIAAQMFQEIFFPVY